VNSDKVVLTCALTGVLTDPNRFPVPVTPEEMASAAQEAWDAGATVLHCHFRDQQEGMGFMPTWDPDVVEQIILAIRDRVPNMIINMSTGVMGDDISGPVSCLERVRPETAALNAGSLNYLKVRRGGGWAWPPLLFDNHVDKIQRFIDVMDAAGIVPECECFDTGIVRSIAMFEQMGMLKPPVHVSFVMGVASGMPAKASWIPLLVDELNPDTHWQVIAIGRTEVWDVHQACAELGGHMRTGLEDTFYLPDGTKATSNGPLIEALARTALDAGRSIASHEEAREILGCRGAD
jgi:3-keto-5-aminohexanoate cleavage enzyme